MGFFGFLGAIPLPAASESAHKFESLFNFLNMMAIVSFVGTIGAAAYFVIKYRRRAEGEKTPYIPHNYTVEFLSVLVTSIVAAIVFIWGWRDYKDSITPRQDEYEINVMGQQWSWQIQYPNGKSFVNELYVPRGRPVHLIMSSKDVLHSFFIPAFRIKQDTVPGQFTSLRFTATDVGDYDLFCAEYCGTSHSGMIGKVHVLDTEDFQAFLNGTYKKPIAKAGEASGAPKQLSMVEQGAILFKTKTCNTCHSVDGSRLVGPSFKGLYGRDEELVDGSKVKVDENYIRESVMDPMKKIAKGYPPAMPTFRGIVTDDEMNYLIAYMKTLK
jgi:cytochrome c oxidase subunit II